MKIRILPLTVVVLSLSSLPVSGAFAAPQAKTGAKNAPPADQANAGPVHRGKVVSTMKASGYTYIQVKTDQFTRWLATTETEVAVGDQIEFPEGMLMKNFKSKALNRNFDEIYFIPGIQNASKGQTGAAPGADPHAGLGMSPKGSAGIEPVKPGTIKKADGGYTVAEIIQKKDALKGKNASVRGKVMKVNRGIMGKNWIHLQDGTAEAGAFDLLVTSAQDAKEGDVVVVSGKVGVDRDFGAGYKYAVILEDAKVMGQ